MNTKIKLKWVILFIFFISIFDIGEASFKEFGFKVGKYISTGEWVEVEYIDLYLIK